MALDLYESFARRHDLFFGILIADNQVHSVLNCVCGTAHDIHLVVNRDECSRVFVIDYFGQRARYNVPLTSHTVKEAVI